MFLGQRHTAASESVDNNRLAGIVHQYTRVLDPWGAKSQKDLRRSDNYHNYMNNRRRHRALQMCTGYDVNPQFVSHRRIVGPWFCYRGNIDRQIRGVRL